MSQLAMHAAQGIFMSGDSAPSVRRFSISLRGFAVLILLTFVTLPVNGQVKAEPGVDKTRFWRTVVYLREAPAALQNDFAVTSLKALAQAYLQEAELARMEAGGSQENSRLMGWSLAVRHYSGQLLTVLEELEQNALPVQISMGQGDIAVIVISGKTVMFSHPRPDQQFAFEQQALLDFCSRQDCEQFFPREAQNQPIPVSTSLVRPDWSFEERGPVCAHKGIQVHFRSADNLGQSRSICEQLLQEVMTLADEAAWQDRHAVDIDWQGVTIESTPGRTGHIIRLNEQGDAILATVPLLHSSPRLLSALKPWLKSRAKGEGGIEITLEAVDYGWPE